MMYVADGGTGTAELAGVRLLALVSPSHDLTETRHRGTGHEDQRPDPALAGECSFTLIPRADQISDGQLASCRREAAEPPDQEC